MSAQVVLPQTKLPQHSRVGTTSASSNKQNSATIINKTGSATGSNRFNRYRPPRKPEIQMDKNELKQKLTPLQYKVTQEKFTERAYTGEYLRLNDRGIYCCVVCNEELFSSETKYDSGCGWPAFFNTIDSEKLILQTDLTHVGGNLLLLALNQDLARTEVTCAKCGAHLGHVFDDGPKPTGKRYCVNSASLKFRKANGEEVICDIPTSGSCCFRSPNKTSATTPTTLTSTNPTNNFDDNNPNLNTNPTQTSANVKKKEEKDGKLIKPVRNDSKINEIKSRLQAHANGKQNKTKSLSPVRYHPEAISSGQIQPTQPSPPIQQQQPIYSSLHAKRVQMNREDFFKSTNTTTTTTPSSNNHNSSVDKTKKTNNEMDKRLNSQLAMDIAQNAAIGNKPVLNRFLNKKTVGDELQIRHDFNNNRTITNNKYSDVKSRYLDHLDTLGKKSVLRHTTFGGKKSSTNATTSAVGNISTSTMADNNLVLESDL